MGGGLQDEHDDSGGQGRVHGGDNCRGVDQEMEPQPRLGGAIEHVGGHQAPFVVVVAVVK